MTPRRTTVYLAVGLLFFGFLGAIGNAQETSGPVKAVQLTGLKGVKDNTKGTLSVESGNLHFVHGKENSDVSVTSIQDVVTGGDSREAVGKTVGIMGMAAPYGGGRVLSLFRTKIDTLTEERMSGQRGGLLSTLGFPAVQCRSITRAVDEALTNIVRHSYGNRLDKPIAMYFRRTQRSHEGEVQHGLEILLCDHGPEVDASKLKGRPLEKRRPGGLGLHLIHQAMDTVEFTRKGPTNRLRLVKYLAPASDAS